METLHGIRGIKKIAVPTLILLFGGLALMFARHQHFLKQQAYYSRILYDTVSDDGRLICNKDVYELINPYIRYIRWVPFEDRGEIEPHLKFYASPGDVNYLACLARSESMVQLYMEALSRFPQKQEVITINKPHYFAVWKIYSDTTNLTR
jgi:hypothetical protein